MRNILRYLTLCLLGTVAVSCVKDIDKIGTPEPNAPTIIAGEDAMAGEIIIKFKPEMEEILDSTFTRSGGEATRSGIPSTDEILDILGAYSFERVFPIDDRHEERTRESGLHLWYLVRFDEGENLSDAYARLAQLGEIEKLQYNHTIHRSYNPEAKPHFMSCEELTQTATRAASDLPFNDPGLYRQWCYINRGNHNFAQPWAGVIAGCDAGCEEAWKLCTGDEDIIVAVMDEAVMWSHPDLQDNIWINDSEELHAGNDNDGNGYKDDRYGYNFVRNTAAVSWTSNGSTGHGTHVAGTIAAVNDNGIGVAGIAGGRGGKGGVKIMTCQIFDGMNAANLIMEARAMKYAADNGAVILQCSWGYNSAKSNLLMGYTPGPATEEEWAATYPLEKESLDYFIHNAGSPNGVIDGGLAIFASGNEYAAQSSFPAAYSKCISVAALAADYTPSSYTNYGTEVTLSAPGGDMEYYGTPGEEDATYDEQGVMCEQGAIFSTLVLNGVAGYGYYEGTSMACPHVSGIAALGLSYAKSLKRHFTAEEFRQLMYDSAEDIDQYMSGEKLYYLNHTSAGATPTKMYLSDYRGKMGRLSDAGALLKAIDGSGREMRLPNLYLAPNTSATIDLNSYIEGKAESVSVANESVAKAELKSDTLVVTAIGEGQSSLTLSCSNGDKHYITITVREGAMGNGWF